MTEYKLLWKEHVDMPNKCLINVDEFFTEELDWALDKEDFAYDFETSGLNIKAEVFWVRCVSFHNDDISLSVQIRNDDGSQICPKSETMLFEWLSNQTGTIAHNSTYECGVMYRATGKFVKPLADTYVLFKDLSNEGFLGQAWSLDYACTELLDWPKYSDDLVTHLKAKGLKKSQMCHADWDILGYYNQLDAAATWEIYKRFRQVMDDNPIWGQALWGCHQEDVMALLELQVMAYDGGLTINDEKLSSYSDTLIAEIADKKAAFFAHPKIAEAMKLWDEKVLLDYNSIMPKVRHKADGELHGGYVRSMKLWVDKKDKFIEDNRFNLDSPNQLKWLVTNIFDVHVKGKTATIKE